jgi:hypothetical protein
MPASPSEIEALLEAVVNEEEPPPTEEEVQAMLSDPVFLALVDRSLKRYERIMTDKAMDRARRTLAHVFLIDPASVALLAQIRERGPVDPSAMAKKPGAAPTDITRGKRRNRKGRP